MHDSIQAIAFDAFGTLLHITKPGQSLLRLLKHSRQRPLPNPMTRPPGILGLAQALNTTINMDEIEATKPEALFYATLCRKIGCQPSRILMVGDTYRSDYQGARAYGLQAVHLARNANTRPSNLSSEAIITNLLEVLPYLS